MGEGSANGRIRKKEVLVGKDWKVTETRAYDPQGRLIRESVEGGTLITNYTDGVRMNVLANNLSSATISGELVSVYSSGALLREKFYDNNGTLRWSKDFTKKEISTDYFDDSGMSLLKKMGDIEVRAQDIQDGVTEIKIFKSGTQILDTFQPAVVVNGDGSIKYK
jgi:hypothetical protein